MDSINSNTYTNKLGNNYCIYRMPCGYCTLLSKTCPVNACYPTWYSDQVTCSNASPNGTPTGMTNVETNNG